jgi:hypothetical protein
MEHLRLRLLVHFPTQRRRAKKSTAGRSLKAESSCFVLARTGGGRGGTDQLCTGARRLPTQYVPLAAVGEGEDFKTEASDFYAKGLVEKPRVNATCIWG